VAAIVPVSRPLDPAIAIDAMRVASGRAGPTRAALPANADKSAEAFRQFEAFVLQSCIETMLPKNAESVFGKGTAGAIWKSMLAEKLADQISRNGGVGIAQRIAAGPGTQALPARIEASGQSASTVGQANVSDLSITERGDDV